MPRHPMILRGIATAFLGCLLGGMALPAAEGPASGENYVYDSSNRMPLEELLAKHRDKAWEIKAIFPHKGGHLGTYRVGDLIGGGHLHFSIGPVGVDGEGAYVQDKPFSRGMPVLPVVCLMDQGQVVERLPFDKNYC